MQSFGSDKGVTTKPSSTANLMIDSADKPPLVNPFNFQITKPQALLNGYFNRIATTEVVLEWAVENLQGDTLLLDISGATIRSTVTFGDPFAATFSTVAQFLNLIPGTYNGVTLAITQIGNVVRIQSTGGRIQVVASSMATKLGLVVGLGLVTSVRIGVLQPPDLRRYRYVDIVSPQLTVCQDVKDASTAPQVRDVLCRWYFAEDNQETLDALGFPILMGYQPFFRRRLFNPPKQIKWDNNLPVGNLNFEVYGNDGAIVRGLGSNFLMTLQLSEN